jgi:hypothetical protein
MIKILIIAAIAYEVVKFIAREDEEVVQRWDAS